MISIYALIDPTTRKVRYVGRAKDPKKRFRQHLKNYDRLDSYCQRWIQSVLRQGKEPRLKILEECDESIWAERERYWIAYYRAKGCRLTNITEGGDGVISITLEKEAQRRVKLSNTKKGMIFSNQHKQSLSKAAKLKFKNNPSLKIQISKSIAKLAEEQVLQIWKLANEGNMSQEKIGRLYNISQTLVSEIKSGKKYKYVTERLKNGVKNIKAYKNEKLVQDTLFRYQSGVTVEQIAFEDGVSADSIRRRLKKALGIPLSDYEAKKRREQVYDLLDKGMSISDIAKVVGIKQNSVWKMLYRERNSDRYGKNTG